MIGGLKVIKINFVIMKFIHLSLNFSRKTVCKKFENLILL